MSFCLFFGFCFVFGVGRWEGDLCYWCWEVIFFGVICFVFSFFWGGSGFDVFVIYGLF